ncbi:MAG: sarcosine oxidase subunit gamma [Litoreibacter sp.]|nr:sarcosine oxidase subunit gamma [Litoreibacter sp.]
MSDAISALDGARSEGSAVVEELGLRGMITLRGDLSSKTVAAAVKNLTGLNLPQQRMCNSRAAYGVAWMSPDELLVMIPYGEAEAATAKIAGALAKEHALVVNVSDARAVFAIRGAGAREVLAKLAPVDLSKERFEPGQFRRTRLAQVPAAFWLRDPDRFELICFRSVAQYVFDLLKTSAAPGAEVGFL